MNDLIAKLKYVWPFVLSFIGLLSWAVSQAVTVSESQAQIDRNTTSVEEIEEEIDAHEKEGQHPQLSEKLIRLESDVNHIKTNQSTNFESIKGTLDVMQEDIKEMNRRSHRHR